MIKAFYGLSILLVIGVISTSAVYAQEPEIKLVSWIPHTIYTDDQTTFTAKIYDAKYNPRGDPESNNPTIDGVNVVFLILNESGETEYHFQGVTEYGLFQPKFILPENFRNGKYFVEIMAWNANSFEHDYKIIFIDDKQIIKGGNPP